MERAASLGHSITESVRACVQVGVVSIRKQCIHARGCVNAFVCVLSRNAHAHAERQRQTAT